MRDVDVVFLTLLPRSSFNCGDKVKVALRSSACSLSCHVNFWQNIVLDITRMQCGGPQQSRDKIKKTKGEVGREVILFATSLYVLP